MSTPSQDWSTPTLLIFITSTLAAFPPNLRTQQTTQTPNGILHTNASCDPHSFNITIFTEQSFGGMLFAKEFSQDCRAFGDSSNALTLRLPTSGCGVSLKTSEDRVSYTVTVVLQQDKHLRQISDQEARIRCSVDNSGDREDFSAKMKGILKKVNKNHRKSRMKIDWAETLEEEINSSENNAHLISEALSAARAWMEIIPEKSSNRDIESLKVGQPALLVVKSTLPVGIGFRVVDCMAHDGLGDSYQKLLDDNGCPFDELLLPALDLKPARPIALMKHQEAVAKFAAFKFPDRDRLHLSCSLKLCKKNCEKVDCLNLNKTDNRLGRNLERVEDIFERMEVFNSVEVKAPAIDIEEDYIQYGKNYNGAKPSMSFGNIPGDRTFCVSPSSMALAFCVLGLIFLIAVFVTAWSLLKARRAGTNIPYYTRSLFSSSGGSGYGGSKLLLHESPCLSHSRNMSYGRIF